MEDGLQFNMLMKLAVSKIELLQLLKLQLGHFFILNDAESNLLDKTIDEVMVRCELCFSQNPNKYYKNDNEVYFNPYHSVQYMTFLYYYSNTLYRIKGLIHERFLCDKIYYLNKVMNGVDIYYAVELPDYFSAEHPVGSVLGRGQYGKGFMFYQNCSVGGFHLPDNKIVYPVIGENVKMFAGSMILGNCKIGDNVNIGAGALLKNQDVPSGVNVFGESPNIVIKLIK